MLARMWSEILTQVKGWGRRDPSELFHVVLEFFNGPQWPG